MVLKFCPNITTVRIINTEKDVNECFTRIPLIPRSLRVLELRAVTVLSSLEDFLKAPILGSLILHLRQSDRLYDPNGIYRRFIVAANEVFAYSHPSVSVEDAEGELWLNAWSEFPLIDREFNHRSRIFTLPYTPYGSPDTSDLDELFEDIPQFLLNGEGSSYFD
ncbi:hypothetical protein TWF192_005733 [Orbilia oligospora]|uniref:Uncharacterized protein n=1 Tax=Orbilia oligospora TaxID=2813651 RepID=A0A6G1MLT8_ORBOL|nr:hypothetical protein TWF191_003906 [Orbilia oligospora]KAF3263452.1 hypothetical protein TWF192_005733 [Orbilia oligospora]